jgi:glyoxylate reductase
MTRIFITRKLPSIARELLAKQFEVVVHEENAPFPAASLGAVVRDFDGVLATVVDRFDSALLGQSRCLKAISNYAVGLDNIDLDAARRHGVTVYNTPDVVTESTADLTFALLLALERQVGPAADFVKRDQWRSWDPWLFLGRSLSGKVMGICGLGRIGKAVARRAVGFGMKIVYHDPLPQCVTDPLLAEARAVGLEELLESCDYLSIHLPATNETLGMFNSQLLAKLKRGPVLINMARGTVVDTAALIMALEKGWVRGAALDVSDPEPLSAASPLCHMNNVIVTPHIGTATEDCRFAMAKVAAENLLRHFQG